MLVSLPVLQWQDAGGWAGAANRGGPAGGQDAHHGERDVWLHGAGGRRPTGRDRWRLPQARHLDARRRELTAIPW